jgi:copper(I)-binding protein
MRTSVIAGILVMALGLVGLIRGSVPLPASGQGAAAPVTVVDAWVAAPVPPTKAAAGYFTVYNNSDSAADLVKVTTSAGATNTLHTVEKGQMTAVEGGLIIPAHSSLVLSVGEGHVMIQDLFGDLQAGDLVSMQLTFANLPPVNATAKVYAPGTHP